MKRKYIRITAVPPGEAPAEIRAAWVGVRIPLPTLHRSPRQWKTAGVLSGPKTLLSRVAALFSGQTGRSRGYAVSVIEALAALEEVRPEAARWWRENAPHLTGFGGAFVFAEEVCQEEHGDDPT